MREGRGGLDSKGDREFGLRKSCSTLSFHVPRRPVGTPPSLHDSPGSPGMRVDSPPPPEVPPKSRDRANTAPEAVDELRERVAGAMLERERLQEMIDEIMERQSVYLGSTPGTPRSAAGLAAGESRSALGRTWVPCLDVGLLTTSVDYHLPAIPAMPPSAPSFAERLNPDLHRHPQTPTAPSSSSHQAPPPTTTHPTPDANANTNTNASFPELVPRPLQIIPFQGPPTPPRSRGAEDAPLQPPLPLVLRPPLRKKKSFSSVSAWLFPGQLGHQRGVSVDSVTNAPGPVREGFYQCVSPPVTAGGRVSGETVSSLGSLGTGGSGGVGGGDGAY